MSCQCRNKDCVLCGDKFVNRTTFKFHFDCFSSSTWIPVSLYLMTIQYIGWGPVQGVTWHLTKVNLNRLQHTCDLNRDKRTRKWSSILLVKVLYKSMIRGAHKNVGMVLEWAPEFVVWCNFFSPQTSWVNFKTHLFQHQLSLNHEMCQSIHKSTPVENFVN